MGDVEKLPGDYVAGFIDGEGCFYLTYRSEVKYSRPGKPKYFGWNSYFALTLREDDIDILNKIKSTLGCGNVYFLNNKKTGKRLAYLGVQNITDLYEKLMPFFERYPLRAKKRLDFELWCQALRILYLNKKSRLRRSPEDNNRLQSIRKQMQVYKASMKREYKNNPQI